MPEKLARYFQFAELQTNWRTEILAGFTTFLTMAYIIFVNPSILREAGMPFAAVMAATCLSAAFGSILMGAFARYPIALAPGMGLNAYFTYVVCKGMGVPWQTALGAVFISGVVFLLLTLAGVRELIVNAVPHELFAAVAAGIGLFIAFIGLKNAGIVVDHAATLVTLGDLRSGPTALALFGLVVTAGLIAWNVRGAMLIGVLLTTVAAAMTGSLTWSPQPAGFEQLSATAGKLDIGAALKVGLLEVVFVFLFVDLFDNLGTLVAVGKKANLFDEANRIPRMQQILVTDSLATIAGSLTGTSTVVSYIESAAGVAAGGRSGVTAIVCGVLFLIALPLAPLIGAVPAAATAPALIIVGSLMASHLAEIDWSKTVVAVPSFLTVLTIPLTFSIANGLSFGFAAYVVLKVIRGEFRDLNWMTVTLCVLFLARFFYLGGG